MTGVGVVAALPREARAARAGLGRDGAAGWFEVVRSGVGPTRARIAAERLLDAGATLLLSVGVAGALRRELKPGALIVPDEIVTETAAWHPDTGLTAALRAALSGPLAPACGRLLANPTVLATPAEKRLAGERFDCIAVDMESAGVCAAAAAAGCPIAVIRVVADAHSDPIPERLLALLAEGRRASPGLLLRDFWSQPRALIQSARLRYRYRRACRELERALAQCAPVLRERVTSAASIRKIGLP